MEPNTRYHFICYTKSEDDEDFVMGSASNSHECNTAPPRAVIYPYAKTDINRIEISWQQDNMYDENIRYRVKWLRVDEWEYKQDDSNNKEILCDNNQYII